LEIITIITQTMFVYDQNDSFRLNGFYSSLFSSCLCAQMFVFLSCIGHISLNNQQTIKELVDDVLFEDYRELQHYVLVTSIRYSMYFETKHIDNSSYDDFIKYLESFGTRRYLDDWKEEIHYLIF